MKKILVTPAMDPERFYINRRYCQAAFEAGGQPFFPVYLGQGWQQVDAMLDMCDGLILTGGGDIHACFFDEELHPMANSIYTERDEFEIALCRQALAIDKPILAICRGIQVLNVAAGGDILQHIDGHSFADRRGEEVHKVRVQKGTLLHSILQCEELGVNSIHHQAVGRLGCGLMVSARAEDGIVEAVEIPGKSFALGVQWHPESFAQGSAKQAALFLRFVEACK